ncbi:LANO_0F09274g1_1 [Lachancea nothofagi CBS 11611]|uniref:LANO_0F09274g1_1 n=1 Tax=Lachancea nothofagi CBS 11611 TaxID=1266666 RepID=A0A1G4K9T8_9SACH|nr:LANO_0F09274g1_1 [Lachancea nothofagi CBS 11611]
MALSESQELQLIEKADLRFVLASSEDALERNLDIFFPAVLLKLSSEHAAVRQLVFQVIKNVMGRISSLTGVKLPTAKLVAQSKEKSHESPAVGQYSLLFAARGVDRMGVEEKRELVPQVIAGFSLLPEALQPRMFNILCKLLLNWKAPRKGTSEEDAVRKFLDVGSVADKKSILEKFTGFFLLNPVKVDPQANVIPRGYSCPGLTVSEVEFYTYSAGISFSREHLLAYKEAIFWFVVSGFVLDDQSIIEFLTIVSTDSSDLSNHALALSKRLRVPYEDALFVNNVISLYIGDTTINRPPAGPALQEKLLSILSNSIIATRDSSRVSLISSIGLNSSHFKLRSMSLSFVQHVAKYNHPALAAHDLSADYSTNIASLIRNNLHTEGWPKFQLNSSVPNFALSLEQRRKQYETLGVILKQDPFYLRDLSFVEFLIDSLRGDLSAFRMTIQEALNSLNQLMKTLSEDSKIRIKEIGRKLLTDNFDLYQGDTDNKDALMYCRGVIINFLNSAFPFQDAESRFLNIMGTFKENRYDIKEASSKGLHPYWFQIAHSDGASKSGKMKRIASDQFDEITFPKTQAMLDQFNTEFKNLATGRNDTFKQSIDLVAKFILRNLVSEATAGKKTSVVQDEHWQLRIESSMQMDGKVRSLVERGLAKIDSTVFTQFLRSIIAELANGRFVTADKKAGSEDISFSSAVVLFTEFAQPVVRQKLYNFLPQLYELLDKHNSLPDDEIDRIGKLYGTIFASCADENDISVILSKTDVPIESSSFVPAIISACYSVPLCNLQCKKMCGEDILRYITKIMSALEVKTTRTVSMKCMGTLLKFGLLNLLGEKQRKDIIESLTNILQKNSLGGRQSMMLWSLLSLYATEPATVEEYFVALQLSHSSKEVDLHFYTGEAISVLASRWKSDVLIYEDRLEEHIIDSLQSTFDDRFSAPILSKLLALCQNPKPSLRKAACIWLLCFVQYSRESCAVRTLAKEIHLCFVRFLAESDDFVQDSASRGLGLIYEVSGKELQDDMLKGLLKSFIDPEATLSLTNGTITSESQLFEPGSMNTGEGSLSTYKDILNLASEAGDPSMVYKFMPLARNSALWSSRKGVAFGLTSIFSKISLEELLSSNKMSTQKLIPLLFRYRFDPYRNVADAMNKIWQTVVKSTADTVAEYHDSILDNVLKGMGAKDWRVREASGYALIDLLENSNEKAYQESLEMIWTMAFRTMDDIKESVRSAGLKLTKKLSKSLIRSAAKGNGQTEASQQMLEKLIPFFLGPKGLNSDAEEVKSFALETLVTLIEESGSALKSFTPLLTYEFLLLLSPLEPQAINYLTMNADKYNTSASAVNAQRALSIQDSPLMKSIEKLLNLSTTDSIPEVVERVVLASKRSIGLPSKVGASRAITLLVALYPNDLTPYGSKMLKACFSGLNDRSDAISEAYATSFGRVCKVCKPEKVVKYGAKLIDKYFNADAEADRILTGLAVESTFKYSPAMFESIASIFLPFIFIAKHDVEKVSEVFTRLWDEATSSGSGSVKLYLAEIITLSNQNLKSQDFNTRLTCAKSICDVCSYTNSDTPEELVNRLLSAMLESSTGRTWQGKDVVIDTLITLATKFKSNLQANPEQKAALEKRLVTELSKDNHIYVRKILPRYMSFIAEFPQSELLEKGLEAAREIVLKIDNGGTDLDSEDNESDLTYKKQRLASSLTRKSQKENISSEEYKIKLVKTSAGALEASMQVQKLTELLEFITATSMGLFESKSVVNTWRSQTAVSDIGLLLLKSNTDISNKQLVESLRKLWAKSFQEAIKPDSIESVKIQMIRFGKELRNNKLAFDFVVENNLRELFLSDPSSKVVVELNNAGIM